MRAFVEQMQVDVAQRGKKPIGIAALPRRAVHVRETQTVGLRQVHPGHERAVEIGQAFGFTLELDDSAIVEQALHSGGVGGKRAYENTAFAAERDWVRTEDRVRAGVLTGEQAAQVTAGWQRQGWLGRRVCGAFSGWHGVVLLRGR